MRGRSRSPRGSGSASSSSSRHEVEAGQPVPHGRSREVHAVVVVPERAGPLPHRVAVLAHGLGEDAAVAAVLTVGAVLSRLRPALRREGQVGGVAVRLRRRVPAVEVDHLRVGQLVAVPHDDGAVATGPDGRAGQQALVPADLRAQPGQDLADGRPGGDLVQVGAVDEAGGASTGGTANGREKGAGSRAVLSIVAPSATLLLPGAASPSGAGAVRAARRRERRRPQQADELSS